MKRLIFTLGIVGLLSFLSMTAGAFEDEYPRAQSLYAKGQRLVRDGNYPGAIDAYRELVDGFKNSKYRDIYNYALARAYNLSGDYRNASSVLNNFHILFPASPLTPYAYHLRGNAAYRLRQLKKAFLSYASAYRHADDSRLRLLSRRSLLTVVENGYIPPDSIVMLIPRDLECPLKSRIAYLMKDHFSPEAYAAYLGDCPERTESGTPTTAPMTTGRPTLGVLLPLSGPYAKYGQAILDGAMLAADKLKETGFGFDLLVYDTRADHVTAAREALALAEADVEMVVGPLLSNVAATSAAVLAGRGIPLLVPAASQAGFTELSPGCFQMSPNMETIGRGLAQYAVKHRGLTTLAVITPTTTDELTMAESFASEAERLGAKILAVEKFRSGETDFGPYITDIKEVILGPPEDSTFYITLTGDTLRPAEVPVTFDGLFMPATEKQLFLLLPQLNFYRVTTSYFGTSEWDTDKVLKLGEKTLKDVVFYSGQGAMRHSAEYEAFAVAHDARFAAEPTRLTALGYDAVNLLAEAHRQGQKGPQAVNRFLKTLTEYDGASGRISFGRTRSNLELPLFTLRDNQVKPLVEQPRVVEELPDSAATRPDSIGTQYIKYEY
ncbi:MAG: ABC transporter substrate-binding protein [FCB group bacterium]|nr:ABC transporter substrate-binding protein [FCB group bacterium]